MTVPARRHTIRLPNFNRSFHGFAPISVGCAIEAAAGMVEYSVDTNPRLKVYFSVAALSVAGAWALSNVPELSAYRFAAPSAFVIFGAVLWIYDRFLWRLPIVRLYSGIPILAGTWVGTLVRLDLGAGLVDQRSIRCRVTQTWRKIDFIFEGQTTISTARVVGLSVENPEHVVVRYMYAVRPKLFITNGDYNPAGDGVSELRLEQRDDGRYLTGIYYSEKLRRGDIVLRWIGPADLPLPKDTEPAAMA